MESEKVFLQCQDLTKTYISGFVRTTYILAVKNVWFDVKKGEVIALVGESGSGKTTIAKMILRLIKPTAGHIYLDGKDIFSYNDRDYYQKVQAIFQDPYSDCNPFYRVDRILNKAFDLRGDSLPLDEKKRIVESTSGLVGLNPEEFLGRYPHQLSGGQLQRLLIARTLIIGSDLLIADEPTSMIDASLRAGILNLLLDLKKEEQFSVLFITHDIAQTQYLADRVIVMRKGEIVEMDPTEKVLARPVHPYTKELLASVPRLYEKWGS